MGGHTASGRVESLLEMGTGDHGHGVLNILFHVGVFAGFGGRTTAFLLGSDGVADGGLGSALAELGDIGTGEVLGEVSAEIEGYIGSNGTLSEHGDEDVLPGWLIGQRDVDELIESTGTDQSLVKNIRSVSSSDEEKIFLHARTVHLGQKLVKNSVSGSTAAPSAASGGTNGIKLVEEEDARSGTSRLVEDPTDVGLSLGEEGLTATGRPVEQNSLGWLHAEFVELIGMLDRVENHLAKVGFGVFETTDVRPGSVGDLDNSLSQRRGVGHILSELEVVVSH